MRIYLFKDNFIKDLSRLLCIYCMSEGFAPEGAKPYGIQYIIYNNLLRFFIKLSLNK